MKACRVEIVTFADGERSYFNAGGQLSERENGFTAIYPVEEDVARLELDGSALVMLRSGGSRLQARFSSGEPGELLIGLSEASGGIPLQTHVCSARRTKDGWRILLHYRLMSETERVFRLHIAVNIISEEQ